LCPSPLILNENLKGFSQSIGTVRVGSFRTTSKMTCGNQMNGKNSGKISDISLRVF
jgi:hypothetical protein